MKNSWLFLLALLMLPIAVRSAQTTPALVLTEGVVGGIVAPRIRYQVVVAPIGKGGQQLIWVRTADDHYLRGQIPFEELDRMNAAIIKLGLYQLPVESPPNGADIYGFDTTLAIRTERGLWRNGAPGGCIHIGSNVHPTAEQKATFRKALAEVTQEARKWAKEPADVKDYMQTLNSTWGVVCPPNREPGGR